MLDILKSQRMKVILLKMLIPLRLLLFGITIDLYDVLIILLIVHYPIALYLLLHFSSSTSGKDCPLMACLLASNIVLMVLNNASC